MTRKMKEITDKEEHVEHIKSKLPHTKEKKTRQRAARGVRVKT